MGVRLLVDSLQDGGAGSEGSLTNTLVRITTVRSTQVNFVIIGGIVLLLELSS